MQKIKFQTIGLLIFIACLLAACDIKADLILRNEDILILEIQSEKGIQKKEIKRGSGTFTQFADWLKHNEKGWESTPASYLPSVVLSGRNFSINFLKNMAILNYKDSEGKQHQVYKTIKPEDYNFLKTEGKI
jgi:hypothetical protein